MVFQVFEILNLIYLARYYYVSYSCICAVHILGQPVPNPVQYASPNPPPYQEAPPPYSQYQPAPPPQPMYPQQPFPQTVIAPGLFDSGARFDGVSQARIPPPPPGVAPTGAQMAAMQGHQVIGTQQSSNWFSGGRNDGGYTWGF